MKKAYKREVTGIPGPPSYARVVRAGKPENFIQLFRRRLSHKSIKAYATMPIGIMGRKSLALID